MKVITESQPLGRIRISLSTNHRRTSTLQTRPLALEEYRFFLRSLINTFVGDPASMKPEIKKMMEAILIIYTTSQYYNTSDCMTHLFVKVGP